MIMFLNEENEKNNECEGSYEPVLFVEKGRLFGLPCFEVSQVGVAWLSIMLQIGSALSFIISLYTFKRSTSNDVLAYANYMLANNGLNVTIYFSFVCWLLIPLWQNVRFIHSSRIPNSGSEDESMQSDSTLPLAACNDPEDDDAMSAHLVEDGSLQGGMIRHADVDGILTKTRKKPNGFLCCLCIGACCEFCCLCRYSMRYKKERHVTRYVPFSIYNDIYCLLHPGQRLNPHLPPDMERFGVARAMLFVLATNAKGTFHLYVFAYAVITLAAKYHNVDTEDGDDMVSATFAIISLLCAAVRMRVFVMSTMFGILLIPMNLGWYLALVWFDWCRVISPQKNSYFYKVMYFFWERMSD